MNIQRNIFAGLLIFCIFLTIPIYLDFIGLSQDGSSNPEEYQGQDEPYSETQQRVDEIITQPALELEKIIKDPRERTITINTDYYNMVLSNRSGGSILLYQLTEKNKDLSYKHVGSYDSDQKYGDSLNVTLINNLKLNNNEAPSCAPCLSINGQIIYDAFSLDVKDDFISLAPGENQKLVFSYSIADGIYIEKTIIIDGDGYDFESTYSYSVSSGVGYGGNVELVWDAGIQPTEPGDADVYEAHSAAYIYQNDALESITQSDQNNIPSKTFNGETGWCAIRNKYFSVIIIPENPMDYATLSSKNITTFENRETTPIYTAILGSNLKDGATSKTSSFTTYVGPLDIDHISLLDSSVESIMNFGWSIIKPFSRLVLWFIKTIHYSFGINYGIVLILVAFMMRVIMGPLTKKSAESSAKMQEVAPLQKKLQEKYKDNPQQLQKEMGALWKKHGVNPISGCLPMLLQWPVLMSFFIVFRSTIEFRGQPFIFWIKDLSQPDYLFGLPFHIPMYGDAVAVLPIIMGISMFLTMSIAMQDKSQKTMMYFMNGFFILIFNSFPSGLTLYYTIFNFLSYQQQLSIKKNK